MQGVDPGRGSDGVGEDTRRLARQGLDRHRLAPKEAAEIHLVKYGPGRDAPWEVVGTRDTDLTLTKSVDNPTPVAGGAAFNYTITVSNVGAKPLAATATIVDCIVRPSVSGWPRWSLPTPFTWICSGCRTS